MQRAQEKLTLELISLMQIKPPAKVIDLGCGWGFSSTILASLGFKVTGIDLLEEMVSHCKQKGIEATVGDFCRLQNYFAKNQFDHAISISALQWISKDKKKVLSFARGVKHIAKHKYGIQFYPYSQKELKLVTRIFARVFTSVNVSIIAKNTKKERIYVYGLV